MILEASARLAGAVAASLLALCGAATDRLDDVSARPAGRASVYWGAWIDGDPYRRAGERPWSDAPWDPRSWNRFERNAGKRVSIVHFGQPAPWAQPFSKLPLALARKRGAIPLLDMDTADAARRTGRTATLREIADGAWDRHLRRWARAAARYGAPFFLRLNWEMNGRWFSWGREAATDPDAYVESWRRFHDIAEAQGATNVTWVWCPNVVFDRGTPLARLYPGDAHVDWTCMDGYNPGRHALKPTGWLSFEQLFAPTYAELLSLAPRKPVMIAETASSEVHESGRAAAAKAEWIADALSTQIPRRLPRVKAVAWFNWNAPEGGPRRRWDWPIESSPAARRAFAEAISSPYYATNRFGDLRRHSQIRPLR